jgi:thioesterase domain-containing protein
VGRWDHFFELGGHSLLAVRVIARMRQRLGVEASLGDVFAHPVMADFARALEGGSADPAAGGAEEEPAAVPVRPAGSERPLFLIHEGTGSIDYARVLAPRISAEVPVHALPPVSPGEPPLSTVEGMATRLVRMIQAVQPSGPYRVAGWSFGGLLAYEVAVQLVGRDQAVEFVGMIDTPYPVAPGQTLAGNPAVEIPLIIRGLAMRGGMGELPETGLRELASAAKPRDLDALLEEGSRVGLVPPRVTREEAEGVLERVRSGLCARDAYGPSRLFVPVHLFRAMENPGSDPWLGWRALLPESAVEVVPVPGTHWSMMAPEHVAPLGEALSRALRRAAAGGERRPGSDHSPLVTLRGGDRDRAPLFCVPGAGATVVSFFQLSSALRAGWAVHGLQPRGLDGEQPPHSAVETAAETYLRVVERVRPEGGVHLLGHSYGGWVAFEMARRLREAGRPVESLTLVDTEVPSADPALIRECGGPQAFLRLVSIFERSAERSLEISAAEAEGLDDTGRLALLHGRLVRAGIMPRQSAAGALLGPFRTFAAAVRSSYAPASASPDPVRLVLARDPYLDEETNQRRFAEAAEGWRRRAPDLRVTVASGNHVTVLKQPHVASIAALFDPPSP